jgi:hypothetical protein
MECLEKETKSFEFMRSSFYQEEKSHIVQVLEDYVSIHPYHIPVHEDQNDSRKSNAILKRSNEILSIKAPRQPIPHHREYPEKSPKSHQN